MREEKLSDRSKLRVSSDDFEVGEFENDQIIREK